MHAGPMASQQLFDAVPFYAGLTLDAIGGRGVRWPATAAAAGLEADAVGARPARRAAADRRRRARHAAAGHLAPAVGGARGRPLARRCSFMQPRQVVELSPVDAERLGVRDGDQVEVGSNGTRVRGAARLRAAIPGGSVFLVEGTHEEPANVLTEPLVAVRRVGGRGR